MNVHFQSKKHDYGTPSEIFDPLNDEFGFVLDVCANADNAKCAAFIHEHMDALMQQWCGPAWMNPPYGREIGKFMAKAYQESLNGVTVVCLVPARTDTNWWHEYAMKGEIRFLRGRVKFIGGKHSAPFPSAIVIFRGVK